MMQCFPKSTFSVRLFKGIQVPGLNDYLVPTFFHFLLGELVSNDIPSANVFGVDLSQRMVDISRERKSKSGGNVYMSVIVSDAAQFLSTIEDNSIDCVLASDVFIYVGDISSVLAESSRCLVDNGLVGFTIESYEDSGSDSGLKLLPSGRFGHSREYINEVATLKGFQVFSWEECILRKQGGKDVTGAAVILKKM